MKKSSMISFLLAFSVLPMANGDDVQIGTKGSYFHQGREYPLMPYKDLPPKEISPFTKMLREKSFSDYPQELNLKKYQTPVKDQGNRGSCAYFSAIGLLESAVKRFQGDEINASEEFLIKYGKANLGHFSGDDGSVAYYNLLHGTTKGIGLERDFPYQTSWFKKGLPCYGKKEKGAPTYCFSHGRVSKSDFNKTLPIDLEVSALYEGSENIVSWMANYHQAVVIGLPLNKAGWNGQTGYATHNEKLRRACKKTPDQCGGHSIILTGYDLNKRIFYFKNSWGKDWGLKGYGYMSFDYIDQWAYGNPIVSYLNSKLNLPENYAQEIKAPKIINPAFNSEISGRSGNYITSSFQGKVNFQRNQMIYFSSYVTYKDKDQEGEFKELLKNQSGKYIKGVHYHHFAKTSRAQFGDKSRARLNIPLDEVNVYDLSDKDVALRLSLYYFKDTEGWVKVHRKIEPIEVQ